MKISIYIILCLLTILAVACAPDMKFDREEWARQVDGSYIHRDRMIEDLLETKSLEGLPYDSLIRLLGEPEPYGQLRKYETTYVLVEDFGLDIDPSYVKLLKIKLSADSTVASYEVVEIE